MATHCISSYLLENSKMIWQKWISVPKQYTEAWIILRIAGERQKPNICLFSPLIMLPLSFLPNKNQVYLSGLISKPFTNCCLHLLKSTPLLSLGWFCTCIFLKSIYFSVSSDNVLAYIFITLCWKYSNSTLTSLTSVFFSTDAICQHL